MDESLKLIPQFYVFVFASHNAEFRKVHVVLYQLSFPRYLYVSFFLSRSLCSVLNESVSENLSTYLKS